MTSHDGSWITCSHMVWTRSDGWGGQNPVGLVDRGFADSRIPRCVGRSYGVGRPPRVASALPDRKPFDHPLEVLVPSLAGVQPRHSMYIVYLHTLGWFQGSMQAYYVCVIHDFVP